MEVLRTYEDLYDKRMGVRKEYIDNHPLVSEKFKFHKRESEKLEFAYHLMQHRFDLYGKEDRTFQDGYIQYVEETFTFDNEMLYTLTRDFNHFLRDYVGYMKDIKRKSTLLLD